MTHGLPRAATSSLTASQAMACHGKLSPVSFPPPDQRLPVTASPVLPAPPPTPTCHGAHNTTQQKHIAVQCCAA